MTTPPTLAKSAFQKLDSAGEHIDTLEVAIAGWLPQSHKVWTKEYGDVLQACRDIKQVKRVPPGWPSIAGDAIHNLRAALDHIAFALTVYHQRRQPSEPLPIRCRWRQVAFPIGLTTPKAWPPQALWGVSTPVSDYIRNQQPHLAGNPNAARREVLWMLQELWNRDKHRSLFDVTSALSVISQVSPHERFARAAFGKYAADAVKRVAHRYEGPLEHNERMEVLCLEFHAMPDPHGVAWYLDKYGKLSVQITFEQGPPAFGLPVVELLRRMQARVTSILSDLSTDVDSSRKISVSRSHCPPPRKPRGGP